MQQRILITGAGGFIGRHLCDRLSKTGAVLLGVNGESCVDTIPMKILSLSDKDGLARVIEEFQPDAVIHLAAIASVTYGDTAKMYETNVCGTENLLEALKKVQNKKVRTILISTAGVYGNQDVEYYDEYLPYNPANHYSYSKMLVEYLSRRYEDELETIIVRPFNIIGSGQSEAFLIPKILRHFAERKPRIELGNIDSFRDYVDVDYCVNVLIRLLEAETPPRLLNICSGIPHSCREVIELLKEITGHEIEVVINPEFVRSNEVWRMIGSNQRLNAFMGSEFAPKPIRTTLQKMLAVY